VTITPDEIRVAVLYGGRSAERAVSLNTGAQVSKALQGLGFDVVPIDTGEDEFIAALTRAEANVAFICLHGRFGEDGTVQGLCELLELPYVGSGVLASALALEKVKSKQFFSVVGLPTPDYAVVHRGSLYDVDALVSALGEKTVVKPASEGSSVGMTIVHHSGELAQAIEKAFEYDRDDVVALPTLEIVPEHEFYDYDSKYVPGMSSHIIPARVSEDARTECQRLAVAAHKTLGCRGMSRADTIVEPDGSVWLLEVNTIPGMTATSLVPDAARAAGIEFPELCRMLVGFALEPIR
jgi:D-alanine-D-alanine ligase